MSSYNDELRDTVNTFFIESYDLLNEMENSLLQLEKNSADIELLHAVFRAVHTIKGSSGMFGFDEIEQFTNTVENFLGMLRKNVIGITPQIIWLLLECHDYISQLIAIFNEDQNATLNANLMKQRDSLREKLNEYAPETQESTGDADNTEITASHSTSFPDTTTTVRNECWHISLRFDQNIFRNGLDQQSFISYLQEIGEIVAIYPILDGIPSAEKMDPESCYLGFEIDFKSNAEKKQIEDVFEFLKNDNQIQIISPHSSIIEYAKLLDELPEDPKRMGEILATIGSCTKDEIEEALRLKKMLHKTDIQKNVADKPGEVETTLEKPTDAGISEKQDLIRKFEEMNKPFIRINADKLDTLINLIGEVVITNANVMQHAVRIGDSDLSESVSLLLRLIENIRDSTMNIRMVQIGETFRKFNRIVHDIAQATGKDIKLVVNGGETELDITLIEKINDPLMHLVRNAIDHGIATPEVRKAKNKPPQGTIELKAYHATGSIIIEVNDDGNGLQYEKIHKKAIEMGYLEPNHLFSKSDCIEMLFKPGLSTAEQITEISGRGVGMDVVKRNVESLRGTIYIESEEGKGTSVQMQVPLTLAIIDGFMVSVGESFYVLPLEMIIECDEVSKEEMKEKESHFINLRGELLPYIRLRDLFHENGKETKRENVVIVEYYKKQVGLVVDKLLGEFQTVIKPLGKIFNNLQWISGATILGNGDVALILDIPRLIRHVQDIENKNVAYHEETLKK